MSVIRPVILCGGSGTRLWPLSRELYPKQFMDLGNDTLFARTLKRVQHLENLGRPIVVCNVEHRFFAAGIMQELGIDGDIILEPQARNTAPAIALAAFAALSALNENESEPPCDEPLLLVLPSDHEIEPVEEFCRAVKSASLEAELGFLLTFGINPTRPETGFGYIKSGAIKREAESELYINSYRVEQFVEKPQLEKAEQFLKDKAYTWNSGMFLFKASVYLAELAKYSQDIKDACQQAWQEHSVDHDFIRINAELFAKSASNSIDYAVMEQTQLACVVPLAANWNDLGSWQAFYDAAKHDAKGNAIIGDVVVEETENCYLHSSHRLIAAYGIQDLAVVDTTDAVLVMDLKRSQDVKNIYNILKKAGRSEVATHAKVYRPWGHYSVLDEEKRFQVKLISVKPGAKLSLQLHHHRAEHWVVVSGTAKITVGEKSFILSEDASTYIPLGTVHSLENPGKIPLEIIEVQTGSYLGEDDIVRFKDIYGR